MVLELVFLGLVCMLLGGGLTLYVAWYAEWRVWSQKPVLESQVRRLVETKPRWMDPAICAGVVAYVSGAMLLIAALPLHRRLQPLVFMAALIVSLVGASRLAEGWRKKLIAMADPSSPRAGEARGPQK